MVSYRLEIHCPEDHPRANLERLLERFTDTLEAGGYTHVLTAVDRFGPVPASSLPPDGAVVEDEPEPPKKAPARKKNAG